MTARAPALAGRLDDLPLGDLLGFLASSAQSGTVTFTGQVAASLDLVEGAVAFADTSGDPSVASHLVACGLDEEAVASAGAALGDGRRWTDALVEAGVGAPEARSAVHDHVVNAVFEVLAAGGVEFRYDAADGPTEPARFPMAVDGLVAEAERRRRRWVTVAAVVPSTAVVARLAPALGSGTSITLDAAQWAVVALLDGTRMLSDVVRTLGRTSFDVCETVHGLVEAGAVLVD